MKLLSSRKEKLYITLFYSLSILSQAQHLNLRVKNSSGHAVPNVVVEINNQNVGITDDTGVFSLADTYSSTVDLRLKAFDYADYYMTLELQKDTINNFTITLTVNPETINEIIITAGRKPEHISTVPSSVTILTKQEIETQSDINSNISYILGNTVPGLATATNKVANTGQTLRGRPLLVLIDGIPQSLPLMNGARSIRSLDPYVIEKIEVIKGATSIYGNGSAGGIINYITRKDVGNKPLSGQTKIGTTFNPYHSSGTLDYQIGQYFSGRINNFSYAIGGHLKYNGLQRDGEGLPLGQLGGLSNSYERNIFTKLSYQLNDSSSLQLLYNYYTTVQDEKYKTKPGRYGQEPAIGIRGSEGGKPVGTPYNHNAMLTYTNDALYANTRLDISAYITSFQSMNRYVPKGTVWYGPGQTRIISKKKGMRTNFNTPFTLYNTPIEITYGFDLLSDMTMQDLTDGRILTPQMKMLSIAPYAQLKIDILDDFIFKGGIRYENSNVKINDYTTISTGPNNEGSIAVNGGKLTYRATVFNAGIRYTKYDYFNPFISYSQGFSLNEVGKILRRADANTLNNLETSPVITNNYEIGFSSKYSIFSLQTSYYISTSKYGINLIDVGGYLIPSREPEKIKGFEIALEARVMKSLKMGGTFTTIEGKTENKKGILEYLGEDRIPPNKATAFITYTPFNKATLSLFWINTGNRKHFSPNNNGKYKNGQGPISEVNLFNLNANYKPNDHWSLSLGIDNLFNKTYYPPVSQYRGIHADYTRGVGTTMSFNATYSF